MKKTVMWMALALVSLVAIDAQAEPGCLKVMPGKGLGPLQLKMSQTELKKTGLTITEGAISSWQNVGPFEVRMQGDSGADPSTRAVRRSLKEVKCLEAEGKGKLTALDSLESIAAWIGQCHQVQINTGATIVECAGGVMALQSMDGLHLQVSQDTATASEKPMCSGYVAPGVGVFVPGQGKLEVGLVKEGETWCAGSRLLDTSVVEKDVLGKLAFNTCTTERNRGGVHITCPYQGVKMSFAGPRGVLHAVSAVPIKR